MDLLCFSLFSAIQYSSVTVVDTLTAQRPSLNDPFKSRLSYLHRMGEELPAFLHEVHLKY